MGRLRLRVLAEVGDRVIDLSYVARLTRAPEIGPTAVRALTALENGQRSASMKSHAGAAIEKETPRWSKPLRDARYTTSTGTTGFTTTKKCPRKTEPAARRAGVGRSRPPERPGSRRRGRRSRSVRADREGRRSAMNKHASYQDLHAPRVSQARRARRTPPGRVGGRREGEAGPHAVPA